MHRVAGAMDSFQGLDYNILALLGIEASDNANQVQIWWQTEFSPGLPLPGPINRETVQQDPTWNNTDFLPRNCRLLQYPLGQPRDRGNPGIKPTVFPRMNKVLFIAADVHVL